MADAVISSLVSNVLHKLTSLPIQRFGFCWRLKDDLLILEFGFKKILYVLEDAEKKQVQEKEVELWVKRLTSILLNVENVLDEVLTEAMMQKMNEERGIGYMVSAFFSYDHNQVIFATRIANKIKTIRRELDVVVANSFDLKLTLGGISMDVGVGVGVEMPNKETSSLIHSSKIVFGRNEEMERVVEKICNKDVEGEYDDVGNIPVYAIWGMGGLGKTTLARLVYNHERVSKHFEFKCWISFSKNFQVKELMKGIIESVDKRRCTMFLVETMQDHLQKILRGKKVLIVLDDVWIEESDKEKWDELSKILGFEANGSIVLITTRSKTTRLMMCKVPELQHELGCLLEDDSWSLFKKFAFAEGKKGGDIEKLEPIGKKIVEKCKGLPLALMTLGGLMWSKSSTSDWESVMENDIWKRQDNDILPALKLSYDNLLPHIKQCFAYCCLFPKGYEMEKDLLIVLWKTNGLIPNREEEANSYMLGEAIIDCLVWRSFFQVVDGKYKMHNVIHESARYVMRHNCSVIEPGKELIDLETVFHLSSSCKDFVFSDRDFEKLRSLRSIIIFNIHKGSISRIFDLKYLRVLYLVSLESRTLPESIGELKYLKYLNLSRAEIEELPDSIMYLQNLQVLLMEWCTRVRSLPEGMRYMRNLQHLNVENCTSLEYIPNGINNLQVLLMAWCNALRSLPEDMRFMRNLQHLDLKNCTSLRYIPVGIKELTRLRILPHFLIGKNIGAQIDELEDLDLLELGISGLNNLGGLTDAKKANLKCKRNLSVLRLDWLHIRSDKTNPEVITREEEVLEGLEPNPTLEDLEISRWFGKICRLSWIDNLKSLVKIRFHMCSNCEQIPSLGKLPSLKVITMYAMDSLKSFHDDDNNELGDNVMFPALQELEINMCWNIVRLPSNLPKLELLRLWDCRELVSLPRNLPNLKTLHMTDCKSLRVLPDEIQSFKDLNELKIIRCGNLSREYEKEVSVDWQKISHIPNIVVA